MPATRRPYETAARLRDMFGAGPVRYADAVRAGVSRQSLRSAIARGTVVHLRRGVVAVAPTFAVGPPGPPLDAATVAGLLRDQAIATHHSAAALHHLPAPGSITGAPTLARPGSSPSNRVGYRVRGSRIPRHRRTTIQGQLATTVERTAIDLARGHVLPSALIPLDAALRTLVGSQQHVSGLALRYAVLDPTAREQARAVLLECLEEQRRWPGIAAVRRALPLADPAAESAAESVSRGWLLEAGQTGLQVGFPITVSGRTVWVDLADVESRVVFEVDGWGKYGVTADDARRQLTYERERQRLLESDGWRVRRWALSDGRATVVRMVADSRRP